MCSGCVVPKTGNSFRLSGTQGFANGEFNSSVGGEVEHWIEYGPTLAYGSESEHATRSVAANEPIFTGEFRLTGLTPSTSYHYRLCARDSEQDVPSCGADRTFTTPNLTCGQTISHDFSLSDDVYCDSESGPALVVGAAGIDLNFNGHTLSGPFVFHDVPTAPGSIGVDNGAGHDDVTLRNGGIEDFGQAVYLEDASFNTIRNVFADGIAGVEIRGGEGNVIRSSGLGDSRFGLALNAIGSDGLTVADSTGAQWHLEGSMAQVLRNEIKLGPENSVCLDVLGNRNRIDGNRFHGCPQGVLVLRGGSDNVISNNSVTGGWDDGSAVPDGIIVSAFSANTLVEGNWVFNNVDDGIDVHSASTRLKDNKAQANGDLGIDAVAGVTDLGGNTAGENGNALQCRNVLCGPLVP